MSNLYWQSVLAIYTPTLHLTNNTHQGLEIDRTWRTCYERCDEKDFVD